ncbi:high mobility group box domain-containing protein [Yarrowia lipolytica]|uniref:YALI0F18260p n=2 Tax=Yarrowia lipolytica TaxID=4952 RepID=Q6C192_YARLI|nr:YALI0F18260p [Yarrowia lipolytica CLIB122]RDW23538.1 high mobility group box domain-containing protein [Yarrowia lipolytica]RDW32811.1 high mobility group box domain-containing protein [Yarrowia lipolytica]RDW45675.1 high mobility group box domain-containing protein [Yarrowia lipolytica]RDW53595.1 high mobility group box domain-containing protein [Yarrowia lipolytica]CAG78379.1 YALI0F18260p [Yarrowia lipolytica CLIB122]|eukprot:XP_505570.1 YALI0F18260p [Yarrowia lipolytica CLIB122]
MAKSKIYYTPSDITNTKTLHDNAATVQFLTSELTESAKVAALVATESWQRLVECVAHTRGLDNKETKAFVEKWSPDNVDITLSEELSNGKRFRDEVELTPTGRIKKKRVVDPNMPKKPMTVFLAFSTKKRAEIRAARLARGEPPLQNSEMANEVAELWGKLSDAEKEPYQIEYQKKLIDYQSRKNKYIESKAANVAAAALAEEVEEAEEEAEEEAVEEAVEEEEEEEEDEEEEEEEEEPEPIKSPKKNKKSKDKKNRRSSKSSKE